MEFAGGLALLPGGGVLMTGAVGSDAGFIDGFIAWYDGDGDNWIPDVVIDGDADMDIDVLYDVAIADGYAVAVGAQDPAGADASERLETLARAVELVRDISQS